MTSDPHRLYNLDVFEYELDVPMALYGSIPFVIGHAPDRSLGLLWLNAAETWIDVERLTADGKTPLVSTHWFSESGIIDVWGFVGNTPAQVLYKYTAVTGTERDKTGDAVLGRRSRCWDAAPTTLWTGLRRRPGDAARVCARLPPVPLELQRRGGRRGRRRRYECHPNQVTGPSSVSASLTFTEQYRV